MENARPATRLDRLVTPFVVIPFPGEAARLIRQSGGIPVVAMRGEYLDGCVVFVLMSDDPSGPRGEIERHASVSARTEHCRFMPKEHHVADALMAVDMAECEWCEGEECVHSYRRVFGSV